MIYKLSKPITECKVGVLGLRKHLLIPALLKQGIDYVTLDTIEDITSEFDLIFLAGLYYIVPEEKINLPSMGIFCFHETPLPEGRGHAPIHWTISNKRLNITASLFKIDKQVDNGLICYQYNVPVNALDTYNELEEKRCQAVISCWENFLFEVIESSAICMRLQSGRTSYNSKRSPKDSELDVNKPLKDLWDDIRVCDNEKFPAYFIVEGKMIYLKYKVADNDNK